MKSWWKHWAAEAKAEGYRPKNEWENLLRTHLETYMPEMKAELEKDGEYEDYLVTKAADAVKKYQEMLSEGVPIPSARELVAESLLPIPKEEADEDLE